MTRPRPRLLELSPARAVWTVSWPMVVIGVLRTLYFLTDSAWIGRLGDDALIAAGGSAFAWWMLLLLGEIAGTGAHALVAQHTGAGRDDEVPRTTVQALWVALALSGVALLALPLVPTYFDLLGFARSSPEHALGQAYLGASLLGGLALSLQAALGGAFRGLGETRTILWITSATVLVNAALDPLLIWGAGPIPGLGIAGAAWATVLANLIGAAVSAVLLVRAGVTLTPDRPDRERIRRVVAIGLPVAARGMAFAAIYVALGRMITSFGSHQMAALGVGHRLESIPYLTCAGFEVGCATLVGQHIGASNPAGAREAVRTALLWTLGFMVPSTFLLWFGAEPLFSLFANETATIEAGALYLRIQVTVFFFMALEAIYEGGFTGVGRTVPAFWIGAVGTGLRVPLAAALAWGLGLGIDGIWWSIALSTAAKGVVMAAIFERMPLDGEAAPARSG